MLDYQPSPGAQHGPRDGISVRGAARPAQIRSGRDLSVLPLLVGGRPGTPPSRMSGALNELPSPHDSVFRVFLLTVNGLAGGVWLCVAFPERA